MDFEKKTNLRYFSNDISSITHVVFYCDGFNTSFSSFVHTLFTVSMLGPLINFLGRILQPSTNVKSKMR